MRGERYDAFIDAYVQTATKLFPKALLHWEDFRPSNARRILESVMSQTDVPLEGESGGGR